MPGTSLHARRVAPTPLSSDDRDRALRIADRLHAELSALVASLPEPAQGGSGMSRHLGIVRNTCQRIAHAISDPAHSLDTLAKLPGVRGLEQFTEAVRAAHPDRATAERADLADAAIQDFANLISDTAGSHAKLIDRLAAQPTTSPRADDHAATRARAELYAAAANVTGRHASSATVINIFRPTPSNNGKTAQLDRATTNGLVGTSVRPGSMPLVISGGDTLRWAGRDDRDLKTLQADPVTGRSPTAILEPFTTRPLPQVTGRGRPGELIQVIDPDHLEDETIVDVFTASVSRVPMYDPETKRLALDQVWYLINCPTVRLIFDVYLHTDLERLVRPSADALLWYPNLSIPGGDKWISRFPGQVRLELLGRGLGSTATPAWARQAELVAYLFDRIGWDPADYVGFRCQVDYPVWRAGYCMSFDPA